MKQLLQKMHGRWTLAFALAAGALAACLLLVSAGASALAHTNTEAFCISCHEMGNNVYKEYQSTIHNKNRTGVRATCPDCHVPREFGPLMLAKLRASKDVYSHFISHTINTPEKFEAKRHEMASNVWQRMKDTDSRECRHCHDANSMSSELQSAKAKVRHAKGVAENLTCIDCHFAIAHKEPDGPGPREMTVSQTR